MKRFSIGIAACALTAALAAFGSTHAATAQPAAGPPPGDTVRGKAAFMSFGCYQCHGTQGQGNFGAGARIAPHPLPYAVVLAYVRKPRGDMPSFSEKILPDKTVADIYAYLSTIPAGKAGSLQPLLSDTTLKPK